MDGSEVTTMMRPEALEGALRIALSGEGVGEVEVSFGRDDLRVTGRHASGLVALSLFPAWAPGARCSEGGALAYAYDSPAGCAPEAIQAGLCRFLADALRERSEQIVGALGFVDRSAQQRRKAAGVAANEAHQVELATALLPEEWRREVGVTGLSDGLVLRFGTDQGVMAIELLLPGPGRDYMCATAAAGLSYALAASTASERELEAACRRLRDLWEGRDAEVTALLLASLPDSDFVPESADAEGEALFFRETWFLDDEDAAAVVRRTFAAETRRIASIDLHLDTPCAQACVFCGYAKAAASDTQEFREQRATLVAWSQHHDRPLLRGLNELLGVLRRQSPPGLMRLTGHDCLRHPLLHDILCRFESERDVPLIVAGPLTRFSEPELAARIAALPTLRGLHCSLFSLDPAVHDATTGTPGSHTQVVAALDNAARFGVPVEVNVVVTGRNTGELHRLITHLAERGARIHLHVVFAETGDGRSNSLRQAPTWPIETLVVSPRLMREALEQLDAGVLGQVETVMAATPCAVPALLRSRARDLDPGHTRFPGVYYSVCEGCSLRSACPGVGPDVAALYGAEHVLPE
jgi:hypothetical protein